MHAFKEIVNYLAGVALLACVCSGMPNQNEKLIKTASLDSPKLPWMPASGGVMYLPEINAFLIPAERFTHQQAFAAPSTQHHILSPVQPPRRRRPIANFIKYMNEKFPQQQLPLHGSHQESSNSKSVNDSPDFNSGINDAKTEISFNKFYGSGVNYYSGYASSNPSYEDITPKISEIDRTLSENDRLLEKISEDLDETTMILMGKAGTRLTLRPVAKAVAGPRGVAVASPIAQAVLRRKDPAPEISYEPDSVAVAGPGGQAYSHPKLVVTYLDEPTNSTADSIPMEPPTNTATEEKTNEEMHKIQQQNSQQK